MAIFNCSIWDYETETIMTKWSAYTVPSSTTWGYFYDKFGYDRSYFITGEFTNPNSEEGTFGSLGGRITGGALIEGEYSVRFYITIEDPTVDYYYSIYRVLQNSSYSGSPTLYQNAQAYPATSAPSVSADSFSVTTPTGYSRRGISTNSNLGSGSVSSSVSITSTSSSSPTKIYYYYYPKTYSVTYNANNGTGTTKSTTRYYNESYILATSGFSRDGYTFAGWKLNNSGTTTYAAGATVPATTSTETLTYYAQWSTASYTVAYNLNGATGTISSTTRNYNTSYTLTSEEPKREGYNFLGWKLNDSGTLYASGATISASTSTSTLTYYAQWSKNSYTVKYDLNGGSGNISSTTRYYNTQYTLTTDKPSKIGYTFAGWQLNGTGTIYQPGATIPASTSTSTLTYKAKWAENITFWYDVSKDPSKNERFDLYINSTNINRLINLVNTYCGKNISKISATTKITADFYNLLANALTANTVSKNTKITAAHWIALQTAFNNKKFTS